MSANIDNTNIDNTNIERYITKQLDRDKYDASSCEKSGYLGKRVITAGDTVSYNPDITFLTLEGLERLKETEETPKK